VARSNTDLTRRGSLLPRMGRNPGDLSHLREGMTLLRAAEGSWPSQDDGKKSIRRTYRSQRRARRGTVAHRIVGEEDASIRDARKESPPPILQRKGKREVVLPPLLVPERERKKRRRGVASPRKERRGFELGIVGEALEGGGKGGGEGCLGKALVGSQRPRSPAR